MDRRQYLGALTVAVAGFAGCSESSDGTDGGDEDDEEPSCDTPGEDLADALPDSDDYEQQGEPSTTEGEQQDNIERGIIAAYVGPDDEQFFFGITEFSSSDAASEEVASVTPGDSDGEFGYIRTGAYVYYASGPDEDAVEELMGASPPLEGCVGANVEFVGDGPGSQTTGRLSVAGSVVGTVSDDAVTDIAVSVRREPGSGAIDLSDITIQFVGPDSVATLTYTSGSLTGPGGASAFAVTAIRDDDDSLSTGDPVLNDDADRAQLRIDLGSGTGSPNELDPGESASLTLTTQEGGETEVRVTVPDTLAGSDTVVLSP